MPVKILIVDNHKQHSDTVIKFIQHIIPRVDVHQLAPATAGRPHKDFAWSTYQLVIMDSDLGAENGLQWFQHYTNEVNRFPPVIFLSSQNNVDIAVQAMKLGARDFILKHNINQNRLKEAILDALKQQPSASDNVVEQAAEYETLMEESTQALPEAQIDKALAAEAAEREALQEESTQTLSEAQIDKAIAAEAAEREALQEESTQALPEAQIDKALAAETTERWALQEERTQALPQAQIDKALADEADSFSNEQTRALRDVSG